MKRLEDMTEPELHDMCSCCGMAIEIVAAKFGVERPQFALLLFNDSELSQYVRNCRREDVIKAMRECADRLERNHDVTR